MEKVSLLLMALSFLHSVVIILKQSFVLKSFLLIFFFKILLTANIILENPPCLLKLFVNLVLHLQFCKEKNEIKVMNKKIYVYSNASKRQA